MSVLEALVGFSVFSLHQSELDDGGGGQKASTHAAASDTAHVIWC